MSFTWVLSFLPHGPILAFIAILAIGLAGGGAGPWFWLEVQAGVSNSVRNTMFKAHK